VRLGAVDYLNARPLVYALDEPSAGFDLRFDVPSICFERLANQEIDLGLIPSITYSALDGLRIVPGMAITSAGPVASVAIFTRQPIDCVRTLALDTSSRTSVALTRILCARVFEVSPSFVSRQPNLAAMLDDCDAALLIGDPALFVDYQAAGATKIDLGEIWTQWTHLPFVWAFWAGPANADIVSPTVVERLRRARDAGVAASDAIADAYCAGAPARQDLARRYLRENIGYEMDEAGLESLQRFYREAAAIKVIAATPDIAFF
jgi:predicted solute-binding protein